MNKELEEYMERWKTLNDVPAGYYRQQVSRYMQEGIIKGDEKGVLDLTQDMVRNLIFTERLLDLKLKG